MEESNLAHCDNQNSSECQNNTLTEPTLPGNTASETETTESGSCETKESSGEQVISDDHEKKIDETSSSSVCSTQDKGGGIETTEEIRKSPTPMDDEGKQEISEDKQISEDKTEDETSKIEDGTSKNKDESNKGSIDEPMDESESDENQEKQTSKNEDESNKESIDEPIDESKSDENQEKQTRKNEDESNKESIDEPMDESKSDENQEKRASKNEDENNKESIDEPMDESKGDENQEKQDSDQECSKIDENEKQDSEISSELIEIEERDTTEEIDAEKSCEDSSHSNNNKETTDDGDDNTAAPMFMEVDPNKEDDKEDNDKPTAETNQDEDVDPIGESAAEWSSQATAEADDAECIIPDTNRQEERDSASAGEETATQEEPPAPTANTDVQGKFLVKGFAGEGLKTCMQCQKEEVPKFHVAQDNTETFLCSEVCLKELTDKNGDKVVVQDKPDENSAEKVTSAQDSDEYVGTCAECAVVVKNPLDAITWESLEFCDTKCLLAYQKRIGSSCILCIKDVPEHFLGKYCVRFGYNLRQFCSSICLVKYKRGLKVCSYCQEEIPENSKGFIANIEKGQFRDFCGVMCMERYKVLKSTAKVDGPCAVCHETKPIEIEYCHDDITNQFCSEPCFVAFKYVNHVQPVKCGTCSKYFASKFLKLHVTSTDGQVKRFCTRICQIVYINVHRRIVSCGWCKVKKYNFDMVQKIVDGETILMCSIPCLRLFEVTPKSTNKPLCNNCFETCRVTYHIANDGGMKNFCTYQCVQEYQGKQNPPLQVTDIPAPAVPTIVKRVARKKQIIPDVPGPLPIITSVRSLAPAVNIQTEPPVKHVVLVKPPDLPEIRNVTTMVKPLTAEQETNIKPEYVDKETQTDRFNGMDLDVIPVPIYIPQPIPMFRLPLLKPSPFPLPIPVPILIPLTKNGANGILKEVKTTQPTPSDPYEADLLVMAQLVADANENKEHQEESMAAESDTEDIPADDGPYSPEPQEPTPTFGDDMLQMALNIANSFSEPAVDLEGALTASTITATTPNMEQSEIVPTPRLVPERSPTRGGRRRGRPARSTRGRGRGRPPVQPEPAVIPPPVQESPPEPVEKPDANMCLKYTFGVNAWKQWVTNKNNELEKTSRRPKLFKTELLQLTSDELNYSLCLFVKEVRKPNGAEYAPDTIYYLCLGIQQYLFENGRIDNIFCDPFYEQFTDCLDEICRKFSTLYNDSQYIVTRVEEEHLWESKQLGAHSPHVLLSTLMFFNTKHFNLTNVEEHMQLSFSHIMKHWKRTPSTPGSAKSTTSRNILLRFYPPQSAVDGKSKKKVYEQQENEENPIRCPVKLYEFYLSKCPESVKTRNDVFYLLPERSCVPDSPVWYSTMALGTEALEKMLHRVKMVKEINVALLSS